MITRSSLTFPDISNLISEDFLLDTARNKRNDLNPFKRGYSLETEGLTTYKQDSVTPLISDFVTIEISDSVTQVTSGSLTLLANSLVYPERIQRG